MNRWKSPAWLAPRYTLLVFSVLLLLTDASRADESDRPSAVHGTLSEINGVAVLRVWGTPYEQGYAHGYLLAAQGFGLLEGVLLDPRISEDPSVYERKVRGYLLPRFQWSPEARDELQGLLDGMRARLGADQLKMQRLGRPLDLSDLMALNTLADWNAAGCSSFAAWGSATGGSGTIVARNLDYLTLPGLAEAQILLVRADAPEGRARTVSVTWPALIGTYTGFNEYGVFVAMHDVDVPFATDAETLVARSLVLREILESVNSASDLDTRVPAILGSRPALCGNNFMVAAPDDGRHLAAQVFEYDGQTQEGRTFHQRTGGTSENQTPRDTLACTNHYRARRPAHGCSRYQSIKRQLDTLAGKRAPVTVAAAFATIAGASDASTLHTVVARLNERSFDVYFARGDRRATANPPHRFEIDKLLAGR